MNVKPKISIVTPSFNQAHFLSETIDSILSQRYANLEYIIIDGGSTDNSAEIIKRHSKYLKYWVSEKDKGQANAINKGLTYCDGEIFNWINSDDILEQGALEFIAEHYQAKKFNILAGAVTDFDEKGNKKYVENRGLTPENIILHNYPFINFHQPGLWIETSLLHKIGGLEESYHYCFDWHMLMRMLVLDPKIVYTDHSLVRFRLHESSKTVSIPQAFKEEYLQIIEEFRHHQLFSSQQAAITNYLAKKRWYQQVDAILHKPGNRLLKSLMLLENSMQEPSIRLDRFTIGAIKRILLNKY